MSRGKLQAAVAAVTAALALAVPLASASAATTTAPAVAPPSQICVLLQQQLRFATQTGNTVLANLLSRVLVFMHCPAPAAG